MGQGTFGFRRHPLGAVASKRSAMPLLPGSTFPSRFHDSKRLCMQALVPIASHPGSAMHAVSAPPQVACTTALPDATAPLAVRATSIPAMVVYGVDTPPGGWHER